MQITIPGMFLSMTSIESTCLMRLSDLDDDEYSATPTPFGRSAGNPFAFGATNASGQDSPTATTPLGHADRAERSFFSHNRGDSVTSDDSAHSFSTRATTKPGTPYSHSSQSSIASPAPVTKKNSFASIRNAFKSSKAPDVPPLPPLDYQSNTIFKNSFNRSTSSLNQTTNRPLPSNASPPYPRPPTPGSSGDIKPTKIAIKSRSHGYSKSHHSQSGSIFNHSDAGSDGHGYPFSSSPPPVPRVPNALGCNIDRAETPPIADFEKDKERGTTDPKTPSAYAFHAIFMRFAASAESKIDAFLRHNLVCFPLPRRFVFSH
jgi:hypothetical protein